jgi:hypothetical protein
MSKSAGTGWSNLAIALFLTDSYRLLRSQFRELFFGRFSRNLQDGVLDHLARLHNVALSAYSSGR